MSRRRRGADFSHLLESLCNATDCGPDLNTAVQDRLSATQSEVTADRTYTGDRKITSKSSNSDTSEACSFKSTILAGQSAETESQGSSENSYRTARSGSTASRLPSEGVSIESVRSEAPSVMNKAITQQFVPQSDLDLSQSTIDSRSSGELNKNIETSNTSSPDRRDMNCNIKSIETALISDPIVSTPRLERMASTPRSEPEANILKRLSQEFIFSPRTFTERLVTIIDESESGFEHENSGVDLSRMTKEFRKMCKFIQDESMPEWAPSLQETLMLGKSRCAEDNEKFLNALIPETIEESPSEISSGDFPSSNQRMNTVAGKTYPKTPLNMFKKTLQGNPEGGSPGSPGSPNSTRQFVYLEKFIDELPGSPRHMENRDCRRSATSDTSENMKEKLMMILKSEQQLASLDDSKSPDFETFDSHEAHGAQDREKTPPRSPESREDHYYSEIRPDVPNVRYGGINEDELSTSLRVELEKQRERCFETARQMQKIEEDAKRANEDYPKVLESYGIDPEIECMKTIKSCLVYQNCWTKVRQKENLKRNEASSVDSGIDTRSISRTLYGSSKKSYNEPSMRSSHKKVEMHEQAEKKSKSETIRVPRSKNERLVTGQIKKTERKTIPTNLCPRTPSKVLTPRRRSPSNLCPVTKSLARSRSRSREKLNPTRRVHSKIETAQTLEKPRDNQNRMKLSVPEMIVGQIDDLALDTNIQASNVKPSPRCEKATQSTLRRGKSPDRKYLTLSPKVCPTVRKSSKERLPRMANLQAASPAASKTPKSPRHRFFVTPGRNVPINTHNVKPKTFFPSMDADIQQDKSPKIVKSLHAPGIYRLGYNNTVVSPVSMYIRGTDIKLIQNVQSRNNEMLLTPSKAATSEEKLRFKLSAKNTPPQNSPRKHCVFTQKSDSESQSDDNDENKQEPVFTLPKAAYELPAQVRTVDQSPKSVGGARTRCLLQSMQNRLVIRHGEKRYVKHDDADVPESVSDMSIHVLKSAEKTNYMNRRK